MADLPSGTITFLFTDVEGSTALWERDRAVMRRAVERHLELLDAAIQAHGGVHFKTVGDAVQAAFPTAPAAVAAALDAQRALLAETWGAIGPLRVRMGLHTTAAEPRDGDYLAPGLNRLARLLAAGHGGQILLTRAAHQLARNNLPADVTFRSLGTHRLRDLEEPEAVFQAVAPDLPDRYPELRSLPHHPTNLVAPPTALIGREDELATVTRLVRDQGARLVTLTGPGGSGKTRLAVEVAADLLDAYPDGVFLVDLAALRDPQLVLPTVASVLNVREQPAQALRDTLATYLAPKSMLLLLDNCEQVIDTAADVAALLAACPRLAVLATSREPLRIRAEREVPIPPLPVPAAGRAPALAELARIPAVALFVARATGSHPSFALTEENAPAVAAICRRLDGLPLAIELAAARVRILSPPALLARLERRLPLLTGGARDLPARQQTMRNTIAWSHDLLDATEQVRFQFLAVFPGSFTFDAAEWVWGEGRGPGESGGGEVASSPATDRSPAPGLPVDPSPSAAAPPPNRDALDLLTSLVAQNLVYGEGDQRGAPRYALLETIREFGLERLAASGRETVARSRHADWCLAFAEHAGPQAKGPDAAVWLGALAVEHANLRTALTWLRDRGDGPRLMRLAVVLLLFWQDHGHYREGRQWLEAALDLGRDAPARDRMRAMSGAGTMAWYQTDVPRATHWHEQALALAREAGDREVEALSLSNLGAQATELGDYDRAVSNYEASLAVARAAGEPEATVLALHNLAHVTWLRREPAAAGRFAEALGLARDGGVSWIVPTILVGFGCAMVDLGEVERAAALFREGLVLGRARGNAADVIEALEGLARVGAAIGHPHEAARLYGAAATMREEIAMPPSPTELAYAAPVLNGLRGALGADGFAAAWADGRSLSQAEAVAVALALTDDGVASAAR
jgi:predicted ATPase/class 3 adenylate cyclase